MNHLGDTNKMGKPETYMTIHSDVLSTMVSEKAHDPQATIRELQDHIQRLEDIIKQASWAFYCENSDKKTAVSMLTILEKAKL